MPANRRINLPVWYSYTDSIQCLNDQTDTYKYRIRPRGYKTFFVPNSIEHEISTAHKPKPLKISTFPAFKLSNVAFSMLIMV